MDQSKILSDHSSPSRSSICDDTDRLLEEEFGEKLHSKSYDSRGSKKVILHVISWVIHAAILLTTLTALNSKLQCDGDRTYSKF